MHKAPDKTVQPSQSNFHKNVLKRTDHGSQDNHKYFELLFFCLYCFGGEMGLIEIKKGKDISASWSKPTFLGKVLGKAW